MIDVEITLPSTVNSLEIIDKQSFDTIADVIADIRKMKKSIDEKRKALTEKAREHVATVNQSAKDACKILEDAELGLLQKLETYFLSVDDDKLASSKLTASKKEKYEYVIDDIQMIPHEYLQLNTELVEKHRDLGYEVPGVKKVTKQTILIKTK